MSRKVNVLMFVPNLQQGGAERQILELYRRLPRSRYDVSLCVWTDVVHYKSYVPAGEPKYVLGQSVMGPRGLAKLVRVLREAKPDILVSYRDKANFWARLATIWAPVPVVLTSCRNQRMAIHHRLVERFLQKRSDRVLTNSAGVADELVRKARVPAERVQVLPNFIDTSRFQPASAETRKAARTKYGIEDGQLAFVLPGRISYQKNQLGLMSALGVLARENRMPPGLQILLAGRDRDRIISRLLPRRIAKHALEPYVRRIGTIAEHDMPDLYAAADAVVLPSIYEGLPNAIIEASNCGIPAIVSTGANADKLVIAGETGFEVPNGNVRALADAIERMARLSVAERAQMGTAASRAIRRLDPDRILRETLDLYESCIARKLPELSESIQCAG